MPCREATNLSRDVDDPRVAFGSPYSLRTSAGRSAVAPAVPPHPLVEPNQMRLSHGTQINTYVTGLSYSS